MANKYTRMIDEFFKKWDSEGKTQYIYLGYCHKGDEDGGCGEYDYIGDSIWEIEDQWPNGMTKDIVWFENSEHENDFGKDFRNLFKELNNAFGSSLEPDYDRTNCYWYRHYFVTRDYEIKTLISRGDIDSDWKLKCAEISTLTENDADNASDKQLFEEIKNNCTQVKNLLNRFKYDINKEKAIEEIKLLIKG